ncbi:PP2Cc protein phosphatase [Cryptococcus neoformans c8]|nr:PP2Cc protein phosphatase [Cryptococcus neoformans var. grubii AD1-83a]OXG45805.1 PP2Cc protein phosphatase [Cryptococcus neoformans var. grubii MW-RSA1955]OXG49379.1 PP2Cc protein phosphatase [Cryptococcus neoformans var. grubii CHC193]OXG56898.1 PP2Cc protein phosphatase [Cryptococcus neoformans var. grubii c8]OXH01382.1 PP2Cc protein phosphatase [Cryptococcus neoformans var. grubii A5-35-17]OXH02659.1 PP2Cc protein phosphatase [Cryptococcus neoformans var. grubii A1-35-8]
MTAMSSSHISLRSLPRLRPRLPRLPAHARRFHDYIRGPMDRGTYKVPLSSPKVVGAFSSRGQREYQEDASSIQALQLSPQELQSSLARLKKPAGWDPSAAGSEFLARQVAYFGIFDGHGGKQVSQYLAKRLHVLVEQVDSTSISPIVEWTKEKHGGYFKRWRGGALQRWTQWADGKREGEEIKEGKGNEAESGQGKTLMTLEERLTLAFLEADKEILTSIEKSDRCGSTASIALLHSLDSPSQPYWAAKKLAVTIAHCGDTRVLLCNRSTGLVTPLTERHHAESRIEASRLRRMGAGLLVSDSYGESRWMGAVENTRGFGDGRWKPSGVAVEPQVETRVIDGDGHAYMILATDGITSLISDQEIIDLARRSLDPSRAAKTIVHFAEDLGASDNCTCVVVPLAGWGDVGGEDRTEDRREYRRRHAETMNTRMQRM